MSFRIYVDESGTHAEQWLIIGMLFVPDHGALHADLCRVKDELHYFNTSPKHKARYKETHLAHFRSPRDAELGQKWLDVFVKHSCYYRCVVIDWSIWNGKYFGDPFESEALKKRRAYKKWAEMLLHPELKSPPSGQPIYHAKLYLDRLKIMQGYDVLEHLRERFTSNYEGASPYIDSFQHTDSWHDANQCLQRCDLLTGALYQQLVPAQKADKRAVCEHLACVLKPFGVKELRPSFGRQYGSTLTRHFPKFSAWFWRPKKD